MRWLASGDDPRLRRASEQPRHRLRALWPTGDGGYVITFRMNIGAHVCMCVCKHRIRTRTHHNHSTRTNRVFDSIRATKTASSTLGRLHVRMDPSAKTPSALRLISMELAGLRREAGPPTRRPSLGQGRCVTGGRSASPLCAPRILLPAPPPRPLATATATCRLATHSGPLPTIQDVQGKNHVFDPPLPLLASPQQQTSPPSILDLVTTTPAPRSRTQTPNCHRLTCLIVAERWLLPRHSGSPSPTIPNSAMPCPVRPLATSILP